MGFATTPVNTVLPPEIEDTLSVGRIALGSSVGGGEEEAPRRPCYSRRLTTDLIMPRWSISAWLAIFTTQRDLETMEKGSVS